MASDGPGRPGVARNRSDGADRAFVVSVEIARPIEDVFALVSDLPRHGEWSPQVFHVEPLDPGPVGVGTRYRTAGLKGAREGVMRTNDVEVTEFEPPTRFGFAATERAGTYRHRLDLSATTGGTRVARTIIPPPKLNPTVFVRHVLLRRVVRRYQQANLDALRIHLESGG